MRVRLPRTNEFGNFGGNGKVFLLLGTDCRQFAECNFEFEPLQHKPSLVDYDLTLEIPVCCGVDATRQSTVQALRTLIKKIEEGECDPCS